MSIIDPLMTKLNQEFAWRTCVTIMQLTEMGQIVLATSSILAFENNNNPQKWRVFWQPGRKATAIT